MTGAVNADTLKCDSRFGVRLHCWILPMVLESDSIVQFWTNYVWNLAGGSLKLWTSMCLTCYIIDGLKFDNNIADINQPTCLGKHTGQHIHEHSQHYSIWLPQTNCIKERNINNLDLEQQSGKRDTCDLYLKTMNLTHTGFLIESPRKSRCQNWEQEKRHTETFGATDLGLYLRCTCSPPSHSKKMPGDKFGHCSVSLTGQDPGIKHAWLT